MSGMKSLDYTYTLFEQFYALKFPTECVVVTTTASDLIIYPEVFHMLVNSI
jgi:hypothetical protein